MKKARKVLVVGTLVLSMFAGTMLNHSVSAAPSGLESNGDFEELKTSNIGSYAGVPAEMEYGTWYTKNGGVVSYTGYNESERSRILPGNNGDTWLGQAIQVKKNTDYVFTAYVKTSLASGNAALEILDADFTAIEQYSIGGTEWGDGTEDPATFNPTGDVAVNADSFAEALKNTGFKRVIVIAKHHDGFCIWPSAYTEHDIENSPYKNGNGDILAEISAACTKYDMDMGLYLSPWDVNAESYGYYDDQGNPLLDEHGNLMNGMTMDEVKEKDALDYNDYYVNQIEEIVTNPIYGNNGLFVEWWMDGAKGEGGDAQEYDTERILSTIKENEPGILIFGGATDSGIHWIGNEKGQASAETWAKIDSVKGDGYSEADGFTYGIPDGDYWSVPESDVSITSGWFYHNGDNPKSMSQFATIYFATVGNGSLLLLNFPPNQNGDLDGTIYSRLNDFRKAIDATFETNLLNGQALASASSVYENALQYSPTKAIDGDDDTYWTTTKGTNTGTVEIQFEKEQTFDVVSIEEYIEQGQRISAFDVEYQNTDDQWVTFGNGKTIGAKKLLRSEPVTATGLRVNITASQAEPMIREIGVYKAAADFEAVQALPQAYTKFVPGDE